MKFVELLKAIENAKIRYLIVGGIAVNLHEIIRPTKDIDFIVYLEKKMSSNFASS